MVVSAQLIGASVLISMVIALVWLQAPVVPAILGAGATGTLLYLRRRRTAMR
jgi:hypothetical protein